MIGATLTHYRITAKLGEGGMGEVYRASDSKLGREVAIKVLPASISRDPQSLARFEREAKALASLNHPHIAAIHGFDADQGTHFLVLELVEGQTLSERLRRGRLPLDEALRVARQIAEAVEAAHAKGIIHRDLKPGNIKLTPEGRVKVLDFGLAKMEESVRGSGTPASDPDAPTLKAETTQPGAVMGTPAYMSPEQARGQEVDKRTDVWAFGCCLFECLAGSKPFRGDTVTDLMAEVLRSEPEWAALPAEVPREVTTLLRRCLEKDPRRRLSSLGDIAILLEDTTQSRQPGPITLTGTETKRPPEPSKRPSHFFRLAPWIAVLVLGTALAVSLVRRPAASAARASQIRTLAVLPFKVNTTDPKLAGLEKWIPLEIVSKLGQVTNFQVVNLPTKIERLVSENKDVDEIARELQVDGLVRTELAGQGEVLTVYVTVVDSTGRAVGKPQNLPASVTKIPLIAGQVAEAVVNGLNVQLSASQRAEIQTADTQNDEAYRSYLKGRDLMSSRRFSEAAVELRRALQLDANYTRAWGHLAGSEWVPFIYGGTNNELAATLKRLSGEAERFRAQRPDDPAAASIRMWMAMLYERDWNKVRTTFWESQRNPKSGSEVVQSMSWYYTFIEGHPEHALRAVEQAGTLDPENLLWRIDRAYQLYSFGRYDEAVRAFRGLPPEMIQLEDYSRVLLAAGDLTGAKEVATRVLTGRPNAWTQCYMAAIHARSGAGHEARKILRELEAQAEQGLHIPYAKIALSYGMLGDFESARRWLRQGLLEGHGDWSMLGLRTAEKLEIFGKLAWYWEIIDGMNFPPLQMDSPFFALEQAMRYGRGTVGPATTSASTNEPPRTLAVLPFVNLSADKQDEYLSDGMTEELLNVLAQVPGLRVPGRSSSFAFKGRSEDNIFRKVGEQLHVATVLEGSVRKAGDKLRITAQLINVADGFQLWSTNYNRDMTNIFAIQSDIAARVAEALKVQLLGAVAAQRKPTDNIEAYQHYLQALNEWNKFTREGFEDCIRHAKDALQLDDRFALAWEAIGRAHTASASMGYVRPNEAWPAAKAALDRALALDDRLAEAHASRAAVAMFSSRDWEGARQGLEAAMQLKPSYADGHELHAFYLIAMGRLPEALAALTRELEVDPLRPNAAAHLGYCRIYLGQPGRAIEEGRKALQRTPDFPNLRAMLTVAHIAQGNAAEGVAVMNQMKGIETNPFALSYLGYAYGASGDKANAERIIAEFERLEKAGDQLPPTYWARVYLGLGEINRALDRLERTPDESDGFVPFIKVQPPFDRLRSEPRFVELLKRLGMDK